MLLNQAGSDTYNDLFLDPETECTGMTRHQDHSR